MITLGQYALGPYTHMEILNKVAQCRVCTEIGKNLKPSFHRRNGNLYRIVLNVTKKFNKNLEDQLSFKKIKIYNSLHVSTISLSIPQ